MTNVTLQATPAFSSSTPYMWETSLAKSLSRVNCACVSSANFFWVGQASTLTARISVSFS